MTDLKVICGGAEGSEMDLQPKLVKRAEDGALCMQVTLGPYEATLPLPEHIANASGDRQKAFFEAVVPGMVEGLRDMARKDRRKIRRKAKQ